MSARRSPMRLVGAVGAGWGLLLLARGSDVFARVQGRRPGDGESDAVRILGARHLLQGAVQVLLPASFPRLEAGVDLLHAGSMVALAAGKPDIRRAALTSGAIAVASAVASLATRSSRAGTRTVT